MSNKDSNNFKPNELLEKTHRISDIGIFELSVVTGEIYWNDVLKEIHEVDQDFVPTLENAFDFLENQKAKILIEEIYAKGIKEGKSFNFDHEIITAKGNKRYLRTYCQPVYKDGTLTTIFGSSINITSRKDSELVLVQKNKLLSIAEQMTNIGYWEWNAITDVEIWSDNLYKIFGRAKGGKITSNTYEEYIHPEDKDYVVKHFSSAIQNKNYPSLTHRIIVDQVIIKTVRSFGEVICDEQGEVVKMFGTCQDITESNSRELELLEKNQQLALAEKMTLVGNWQWNPIANEVLWSDNLYNIYGVAKNELITFETYINYVHEEDRNEVISKLNAGMQDGNFRNSTYKIQLRDGTIKTIKTVGKIITNENGDVLKMFGTCQDITESKNIELELLQKNKLMSISEAMAQIGFWQWKPEKNEFTWSDNLYKMFGFEVGAKISLKLLSTRIHPEDLDMAEHYRSKIIETKTFENFYYRIILEDGTIYNHYIVGQVATDNNGQIIEVMGSTQDVSEIKKRESELLEKNHQLSNAEEMAKIGNWKWNAIKDEFIWSENLYRILGFEMGTKMSLKLLSTRVHPDDKEKISAITKEILKTKKLNKFTYRMISDDGTIKTFEVIGYVITDQNGHVTELVGTTQDVTEIKRRETEILTKNEQLSIAEEIAMIGNWEWDLTNNSLIWSDNLYKIFDFEYVIPMTHDLYLERIPLEDQEIILQNTVESIKKKKFNKISHRIKKRDGSIIFVEHSGKIKTNDNGEVIKVLGTTQDITEQRNAELKIINANIELENSAKKLKIQNDQLAEFNHITSHNLRSPVSNLNALINIYQDETSEIEKAILFEKFEIVIDHLTLTLNTLVESLRIKSNQSIEKEKISFEEILKKTEEILVADIMQSEATIEGNFSNAPEIIYNKIYIESIFLNLIGNAIKYKSEDRAPKIRVTTENLNGKIILKFKDNGLGIDLKNNGHKLFGLNKVFHSHPDAKGFGLFITKAQVETMGGTISAESEVNKGTTFTLNLN
ncbi:PAS domain-containing protein [Aurantibacter crassamenti]|uniref:PAS domain-containing sensor histidine kinase n=1 Tax=Aurantibacter crassamenti TaxID=1837375 RepID=UPI00193A9D7D|nr:PAS domain-containing sensor histidine kinase [Aurantibacter crassamenti]MBM1106079.1 PAS domain-containing protein [Aurantibacter crassamenti]